MVKAVLVTYRRYAVDADRHQAGQAVRLRSARRRRQIDAGVRPAGEPGQFDGQLRTICAPGTAKDDRSSRARPRPQGLGDRRRRVCLAGSTERPTTCGFPARSSPMAGTTFARWAPKAAISWPRPRGRCGLAIVADGEGDSGWRRRSGCSCSGDYDHLGGAHGSRRSRSVAPSGTSVSRSPIGATSDAPTACRRRDGLATPRGGAQLRGDRATGLGLRRAVRAWTGIRLTGGEPTMRAHLPVLVEKLARLRVPQPGPVAGRAPDPSTTTNGATFRLLAGEAPGGRTAPG